MENENKTKHLNFYLPQEGMNVLSSPFQTSLSGDYLKNQKILSQIYDIIYKLYDVKKLETYFPAEQEVYEELEFRKKAVKDTVPLPSKDEFIKLYLMLANHKPVFISILKELSYNLEHSFFFITKFAIPYNNDLNYFQKGLSHIMHNSMVTFRNHYNEINPNIRLKEKVIKFNQLEELEEILETGQVYTIFKNMYYYKNQIPGASESDLMNMNQTNKTLKEFILKPLIHQFNKENLVVIIKRITSIMLPDIILINNPYQIELRFNLLLDLIHHENIKKIIWEFLSSEEKIFIESKNRLEQALEISRKVIKLEKIPKGILLLSSEILGLYEFLEKNKKQDQLEKDREELKQLLKKVTFSNGLYRVKNKDKIYSAPKVIEYILAGKVPNILFATKPIFNKQYTNIDHYDEIFLLLNNKKNISLAIEQVKDLYYKVNDIYFIRILEQMLKIHELSDNELQKILPPHLIDEFITLISKSYINQLPFFKRIIYKLINEKLNKPTLKKFWSDYYNKNKLIIKITSDANSEITSKTPRDKKNPKTQSTNQDTKLDTKTNNLYKNVLSRIEWYLERDTIPTEKILYHDFQNEKQTLNHLFEMAKLNLKSVEELIKIETKNEVYYLSKKYLINNKENLINKYTNKIQELEGIETKDGKYISLKVEKDNLELYKALIKVLNQL